MTRNPRTTPTPHPSYPSHLSHVRNPTELPDPPPALARAHSSLVADMEGRQCSELARLLPLRAKELLNANGGSLAMLEARLAWLAEQVNRLTGRDATHNQYEQAAQLLADELSDAVR